MISKKLLTVVFALISFQAAYATPYITGPTTICVNISGTYTVHGCTSSILWSGPAAMHSAGGTGTSTTVYFSSTGNYGIGVVGACQCYLPVTVVNCLSNNDEAGMIKSNLTNAYVPFNPFGNMPLGFVAVNDMERREEMILSEFLISFLQGL